MGEVKIMTDIYISGQKKKIVKILNNAMSSASLARIAGQKDINALNKKWHTGQPLSFTLVDFLDPATKDESEFKNLVPPDWNEDNEDYLYDYELRLGEIADLGREYEISLSASVQDYQESYSDWNFYAWCKRMTLDYGFRIVLHEVTLESDVSLKGEWSFDTSHKSCIFELVDSQVKVTRIKPEDLDKYLDNMDKLAKEVKMTEKEKMEFIISDLRTAAVRLELEADRLEKELSDPQK
jgi:hypothetical protein